MSLSALAALLAGKRLLIFDLDGTLVDTNPIHARAYAEALAVEGVRADYDRVIGMTTEQGVATLLADADRKVDAERHAELVADKRRRALGLIASDVAPIPGAVEFVRRARNHYKLALCTSASRASVQMVLSRIGLDDIFEMVVTGQDVRQGKPHPEGFLAAAERCGAAPADALVFEDAPSGLAAAAAAGIAAVRIVPKRGAGAASAEAADWSDLSAALEEAVR